MIVSLLVALLLVMPVLAPSHAVASPSNPQAGFTAMSIDTAHHHSEANSGAHGHAAMGDSSVAMSEACETGCSDCSLGCCPGAMGLTMLSLPSPPFIRNAPPELSAESLLLTTYPPESRPPKVR